MTDELKTFIGEKMGEATMCWEPIPSGVFDSQRAVKILDEVYEAIEALISNISIQSRKDKMHENKSFCGCPMCEFHTQAYGLKEPTNDQATN